MLHPLLGEGSQYPGLYGQSGYRRAGEWEISGIIACCCWRLAGAGHDEGGGGGAQSELNLGKIFSGNIVRVGLALV